MKNFKDVYKEKSLFYWCNCLGELNMPGDGEKCFLHRPEDLPPAVRDAYEKYWSEGANAKRYVVSFEGQVGILLTALYNEDYVEDVTKVEVGTYKFTALMAKTFGYLCGKAAMLDFLATDSICEALVGNYSDPDGHELAMFIPTTNTAKTIIELVNLFESCVYTDEDAAFMKAAVSRLE